MAGAIKGIEIAISADTTGVTKGLKEVTSESMKTGKNLKTVESLLKMDPHNTELVAEKQKLLAQNIEQTKDKLNKLKAAQDDVKAAFERGEISEEQYIAFQGEIVKTEQRLKSLENTTEETGDAMDKAGEQTSGFGDKLKSGLAVAAKAAGAALVAVGAAALKLTKEVIQQTGELEQNLGGAKSVFGDYADFIVKKGEDAYKNLGLSQSDYLATANKMGALLQGTGFTAEQSAQMTEKAMQRAADMASVMGIDMSSAMESVAGAAKGNFTMMDNLGVAINDTSIKAYALEKGLGAVETTQDKVNVAMQMFLDKTQQYDGNFAKEATETISGSLGLLEASWNSLIAGLGSGEADIQNLAANLSEALGAVIQNIVPVVESIAASLPTVAQALIPAISGLLPTLIPVAEQVLVGLFDSIVGMLPSLTPVISSALVSFGEAIIRNAPAILQFALDLIEQLGKSLIDALPTLIPSLVSMLLQITEMLLDNIDLLVDGAIMLMEGLTEGLIDAIPVLLEKAPVIIDKLAQSLASNLPKLIECGIRLTIALVQGIIQNLPQLVSAAGQIVVSLFDGIRQFFGNMQSLGTELIGKLRDGIKNMAVQAFTWGADLIQGLINGIKSKIGAITEAVSGVADKIKSFLHFSVPDEGPLTDYETWMPDFMKGLAAGIERNKHLVTNAVRGLANDMVLSPTLSASGSGSGSGGLSQVININLNATISSDMDIRHVAERLGQELQTLTAQNAAMQGAW